MTKEKKKKQKTNKEKEREYAIWRTAINMGIIIFDLFPIPFAGEVVNIAADIGKFIGLDLTPDVSKTVAVSATVTDVIPFVPSHAIDTLLQLKADWKRLKRDKSKK